MKTKSKVRKIPKAQRSRKPVHKNQQFATYVAKQEAAEQKRTEALLAKPVTLSMVFVAEHVQKQLKQFCEKQNLDAASQEKGVFFPESVVIDAYGQNDMIIALKMQQVTCTEWQVEAETHLYNDDTEEFVTVPYAIGLSGITYGELTSGSKVTVPRKGGFKTRWQGLKKELDDGYDEYKERDLTNFRVIQTHVCFIGECYFVNYKMYQEFLFMRGLRDQGVLIESLESLTKIEVEKGKLDYQLQPVKGAMTTAIPVKAFEGVIKESRSQAFSIKKAITA